MTLMSHYPEILRTTRWQNCALSKTVIKIQITLLFKALRRGPVCQFKPHTAYVQNFKYTTLLAPVWRKFINGEGTEQKRQKKRILIKRKFVIDKGPHPEWSLASLTALHWTSQAATNITTRVTTEPHIFARCSEIWREFVRLKHK